MNEIPSCVSFQSLSEKFEITRKELGEAEETIRRITGRDPDKFLSFPKWKSQEGQIQGKPPSFSGKKRPLFPIVKDEDEVPDESNDEDETSAKKPSIQSTVVAAKDSKTRKDSIQEQNVNSKVKARNRRMFGIMLGTLQKFQNEETKRKAQDLKKAEVEQKVEAAVVEERERVKKEKSELFVTRKEKMVQLRCLERKMEIAELHEVWENGQKNMLNYIRTSQNPHVYFLPAHHNKKSKKLLEESQNKIMELIKERRKETEKTLQEVEEYYTRETLPNDKENIGPFEDESQEDPLPGTQAAEIDASLNQEATAETLEENALNNEPTPNMEMPQTTLHSVIGGEAISISSTSADENKVANSTLDKDNAEPEMESRTKMDSMETQVEMADQEFEPIYD